MRLPRGPQGVWSAFRWSLAGLAAAWRSEASFRLELCLAILLVPLALWLGETGVERAVMSAAVLAVLAVELLSSGIEAAVDLVGGERHALAGRAKDMGSAASFIAQVNVALTWGFILVA